MSDAISPASLGTAPETVPVAPNVRVQYNAIASLGKRVLIPESNAFESDPKLLPDEKQVLEDWLKDAQETVEALQKPASSDFKEDLIVVRKHEHELQQSLVIADSLEIVLDEGASALDRRQAFGTFADAYIQNNRWYRAEKDWWIREIQANPEAGASSWAKHCLDFCEDGKTMDTASFTTFLDMISHFDDESTTNTGALMDAAGIPKDIDMSLFHEAAKDLSADVASNEAFERTYVEWKNGQTDTTYTCPVQ